MNKLYLFLDIDGVLTNHFSNLELDDRNIEVFTIFCDSIKNLEVILSSSWCMNDSGLERINSVFKQNNLPKIKRTIKVEFGETKHRGRAIDAFIKHNNINKKNIVIFDDEDIPQWDTSRKSWIEPLRDRLIHINVHDGLTHSDLLKAWKLLGLKPVILAM